MLGRAEVLALTGRSYATLWQWMREGRFPLARKMGDRPVWLSTEIEQWIADLPPHRLKPLRARNAVERDSGD
jgi:predicted DNA-binding transcriptional regulator AlpA